MTDEVTASKPLFAHYTTFFQEFNTFHRFQFSTPVISRISKHNQLSDILVVSVMVFSITGFSKNGKRKHPQRENSLLLFRMHRITEEASGQDRYVNRSENFVPLQPYL